LDPSDWKLLASLTWNMRETILNIEPVKLSQNCNWLTWASHGTNGFSTFNLEKTHKKRTLKPVVPVALLLHYSCLFFSDLRRTKHALPRKMCWSPRTLFMFSLFWVKKARLMSERREKEEEIHCEAILCLCLCRGSLKLNFRDLGTSNCFVTAHN